MCAQSLSCVWPFATAWTMAHQALLLMGFSRQDYWSGLPFLPPRDPPDPGIKLTSLVTPALAGGFLTAGPPGKPILGHRHRHKCLHLVLIKRSSISDLVPQPKDETLTQVIPHATFTLFVLTLNYSMATQRRAETISYWGPSWGPPLTWLLTSQQSQESLEDFPKLIHSQILYPEISYFS